MPACKGGQASQGSRPLLCWWWAASLPPGSGLSVAGGSAHIGRLVASSWRSDDLFQLWVVQGVVGERACACLSSLSQQCVPPDVLLQGAALPMDCTACTFVWTVRLAWCVCEGVLLPVLVPGTAVVLAPFLVVGSEGYSRSCCAHRGLRLAAFECWDSASVRPVVCCI